MMDGSDVFDLCPDTSEFAEDESLVKELTSIRSTYLLDPRKRQLAAFGYIPSPYQSESHHCQCSCNTTKVIPMVHSVKIVNIAIVTPKPKPETCIPRELKNESLSIVLFSNPSAPRKEKERKVIRWESSQHVIHQQSVPQQDSNRIPVQRQRLIFRSDARGGIMKLPVHQRLGTRNQPLIAQVPHQTSSNFQELPRNPQNSNSLPPLHCFSKGNVRSRLGVRKEQY